MKKLLLSIAVSALSVSGISAQTIQEQPAGTVYEDLYRSSTSFYTEMWAGTKKKDVDGTIGKIVFDESGDCYIYNPFSSKTTGTWLKAVKAEDGSYVMSLPQEVYEEENWEGGTTKYYARCMNVTSSDGYYSLEVATDKSEVKFTWRNDSLIMEDGAVLGLVDVDGNWGGAADEGIVLADLKKDIITSVPEGAERKQYKVAYDGEIEGAPSKSKIVDVAYSGSDVYVKGFGSVEDVWVKGVLNEGKVTFQSEQYLGVDKKKEGHLFFNGGRQYLNEEGYQRFAKTDSIVFNIDESKETLTADSAILVTIGLKGLEIEDCYYHPSMTEYFEKGGTPMDPSFQRFTPYTENTYIGQAEFDLYTTNTEGEELNVDNLYYNVYFGDELHTFTPEKHSGLTEDMTDVPYNLEGVFDFYSYGTYHTVYFYEPVDKFGVQLCYKTSDGTVTKSNIVYNDGSTVATGIEKVSDDLSEVEKVEYIDLLGRRVQSPGKGVYVKVAHLKDGKTRTSKMIFK